MPTHPAGASDPVTDTVAAEMLLLGRFTNLAHVEVPALGLIGWEMDKWALVSAALCAWTPENVAERRLALSVDANHTRRPRAGMLFFVRTLGDIVEENHASECRPTLGA